MIIYLRPRERKERRPEERRLPKPPERPLPFRLLVSWLLERKDRCALVGLRIDERMPLEAFLP